MTLYKEIAIILVCQYQSHYSNNIWIGYTMKTIAITISSNDVEKIKTITEYFECSRSEAIRKAIHYLHDNQIIPSLSTISNLKLYDQHKKQD